MIKTEQFLHDCPNDGKEYTLCRKISQFGKRNILVALSTDTIVVLSTDTVAVLNTHTQAELSNDTLGVLRINTLAGFGSLDESLDQLRGLLNGP